MVFNSLNKDNDVFYYSNENECDFLLVKNKVVINSIQVCYDLNEDNKGREISGLSEAMDKFKLNKGLILTNSQEEEIKTEGKKIKVMPVWKWILTKKL